MLQPVAQILRDILKRRGLSMPDGRALYRYRPTAQQLGLIRDHLRLKPARRVLTNTEAAAFVLFAAFQFCREHRSGPWAWSTAVDPLGFPPEEMHRHYTVLEHAIRHYWKRPLHVDARGRNFLSTIAIEGGLPRALLTDRQNTLGKVVADILSDIEAFPQREPIHIAGERAARLPATLQVEGVARLLADLAVGMARLRQRHPLLRSAGRVQDPLRYLDENETNWRDDLPIDLEEQSAQSLIGTLVSADDDIEQEHAVTMEVVLRLRGDAWSLLRRPKPSRRLSAETLKRQCALDSIPARCTLEWCTEGNATRAVAHLTTLRDGDTLRVEWVRDPTIRTTGSVDFALITGGTVLVDGITPPGGEALGEAPWVFRTLDASGEARLLGTGSLSARRAEVLVALPPSIPREEDEQVLGELASGRRIVRLTQTRDFMPEGEHAAYRIRVGEGVDATLTWTIDGRRIRAGAHQQGFLCGMPRLFRHEDGVRQLVTAKLEYAHDPRDWRPLTPMIHGRRCLRAVDPVDSSLLFRDIVNLAPVDFRIRLEPGLNPVPGEIHISGVTREQVGAEPGPWDVEALASDAGCILEVHWDGEPPAHLPLIIGFDDGGRLRVPVPFPAERAGFFGLNGAKVAHQVGLDDLGTVRAFAIHRNAREYSLHARSSVGGVEPHQFRWLATLRWDRETHWLYLDELRPLLQLMLASRDDLDARVELELRRDDVRRPVASLCVAQYSARLAPIRSEDGQVTAVLWEGPPAPDDIRIVARPLSTPGHEGLRLADRPEAGGWALEPAMAAESTWLVIAMSGDECAARPMMVPVDPPCDDPVEAGADLRVLVEIPDAEARRAALSDRLRWLAEHPEDEDWAVVNEHLATLGTLPAGTFDLIRCLVRTPGAAALAALSHAAGGGIGRLAALEDLAFAWWLVPVRAWTRAARRLVARLEDVCRSHGLDVALAREQVEIFAERAPNHGGWAWAISDRLKGGNAPDLPIWIWEVRLQRARETLLRTQSGSQWPRPLREGYEDVLGDARDLFHALRLPAQMTHREEVLDAPVLAAMIAAYAATPTDQQVASLRELRAFDIEWFDEAYTCTLMRIAASDSTIWGNPL